MAEIFDPTAKACALLPGHPELRASLARALRDAYDAGMAKLPVATRLTAEQLQAISDEHALHERPNSSYRRGQWYTDASRAHEQRGLLLADRDSLAAELAAVTKAYVAAEAVAYRATRERDAARAELAEEESENERWRLAMCAIVKRDWPVGGEGDDAGVDALEAGKALLHGTVFLVRPASLGARDSHGSPATLRPFEAVDSSDYPHGLYNGHDLSRAPWPVIYSVGRTPEQAIRALCDIRLGSFGGTLTPLESGDNGLTWGYRFHADGTSCKAAGIHVPGGVVLTWWK